MVERRKALALTIALVLISSVFSFYAGAAGLMPQVTTWIQSSRLDGKAPSAQALDVKRLQQVQRYIERNFVDPVSADKLTEGALKGMVEATGDKYSIYLNPSDYRKFLDHLRSSLTGIGVYVEMEPKTGQVTVVSPIKGSPGEQAGLRPGDVILEVDGKDLAGLSLDEAVTMIRGAKGTKVQLKVQREGVAEPLAFTITRAEVEVPRVKSSMADKAAGVGYIQIVEFSEDVTAEVGRAIDALQRQGMTRLILDLRQNPGGLLNEAIGVSSYFVPAKKPVVHIVYRNGKEQAHEANSGKTLDLPLVVLVDDGSASASEIVAGAIKDYKLGVLMGVKTFGKGSVQTFFDLPDGSGIKLTTAKYLTAGRNSIHEKGIQPDVVVENPEKVIIGETGDVQLQRAIQYIKSM